MIQSNVTMIYLVRHARPAGGWGDDLDPGLDARGAQQAREAALVIAGLTAALPIFTSPMRRCRETAAPLAEHWKTEAVVLPEVTELPSPPLGLQQRASWLRGAMQGDWNGLVQSVPAGSPDYLGWRDGVLQSLARLPSDSVVFTHYIGINAVVGAARGSDAVQVFRPDHASLTVVRFDSARPHVPEVLTLGREVTTAASEAPLLGR